MQIAHRREPTARYGSPRRRASAPNAPCLALGFAFDGRAVTLSLHALTTLRAARDVYRPRVLWHLREAGIPYLVGGTYALEHHAGLVRDTKDLDLFVRRADWSRIADDARASGRPLRAGVHSLAGQGARAASHFVDLIFAGGNGFVEVDDEWLAHGVPSVVLEVPVHLVAAEEMIWSKSFVMERERFDGARRRAHPAQVWTPRIDWVRLLRRFGRHAPVLLSHLVLFQFVYPDHRDDDPRLGHGRTVAHARGRTSRCRRGCAAARWSRASNIWSDIASGDIWMPGRCRYGRMTPQQIAGVDGRDSTRSEQVTVETATAREAASHRASACTTAPWLQHCRSAPGRAAGSPARASAHSTSSHCTERSRPPCRKRSCEAFDSAFGNTQAAQRRPAVRCRR